MVINWDIIEFFHPGYWFLYNNQINALVLIGQSAMGYSAGKPMEKSGVFCLRNRKHVPCFYRVIQIRVEVWENEKCCGNTSRRRMFPQLFRVLPNCHEFLYNSIETRSTCFLFLLENNATRKRKTTCSLWLLKCKFSLLTSSLRQQRALVLCLHRVIQTRFLTNQRACFLRTVF